MIRVIKNFILSLIYSTAMLLILFGLSILFFKMGVKPQ